MTAIERYAALAIQTANPMARNADDVARNLKRVERVIRRGLAAHRAFGPPVRLVVLPEFAFHGIAYRSIAEMQANGIAVPLPGPIDAALARIAAEYDCFIVGGTVIEQDDRYSSHLFNTAPVVGPAGLIAKYRKINAWLPVEPFASPADVGADEGDPIVAVDLPIGRLGVTTCFDNYFPELWRELVARGVDVVASPAALMHPLQDAGANDPWRALCQVRCFENGVFGVFANQGACAEAFPPFGWRGGSYVIDYRGHFLAGDETPGEGFAYATIDLAALRAHRTDALANHFASLRRTRPYPSLRAPAPIETDRVARDRHPDQEALEARTRRARDTHYRRG